MRYILLFVLFILINTPEFAQEYVTPVVITKMSSDVNESSGLINLNGEIWTHNDHGGSATLYQIDTVDGSILQVTVVQNAENKDWEDLTKDANYLYIGDFGNNTGDRTDLKIYKTSLADLAESNVVDAEIINFSYSDQVSWEENHNNHDFDCEAMISSGDYLFLFSKNWVDKQTRVYQLPKQPGTHIAQYIDTYNVDGLITGADLLFSNTLILIGYQTNGISFTWVFKDFPGTDFFSGTQTKLNWTQVSQIEGVCYSDKNGIYAGSEKFGNILDPTLYYLDISEFIASNPYVDMPDTQIFSFGKTITIKPTVNSESIENIQVSDLSGIIVMEVKNINCETNIPLNVAPGVYILTMTTKKETYSKKIMLF